MLNISRQQVLLYCTAALLHCCSVFLVCALLLLLLLLPPLPLLLMLPGAADALLPLRLVLLMLPLQRWPEWPWTSDLN
jgi:hypothetical protein